MFSSTVDAVQCAIDIQAKVGDHNLSLPESERMIFRMGINLGDVISDDGDIYGDGVNVASRLEGMADPGGILVSSAAIDSVRNKVTAGFEYLGERVLKNIEYPVGIYRIDTQVAATAGLPRKSAASRSIVVGLMVLFGTGVAVWFTTSNGWFFESSETVDANSVQESSETDARSEVIETDAPLLDSLNVAGDKPVIAVLPFTNFSNDEEQEYFSDGLTEDLITDISKISGVNVIARNSTFSFKGQSPDIRNVGNVLGATHVIEGSVRRSGNTMRINVQLVDAMDGHQIWGERYDRELKDVFVIQDEVIGHIITSLSLKLSDNETAIIERRGTDSLEAYDLFLKGLRRESFFTREDINAAERLYKEALVFDPSYAEVYAHLAQIYSLQVENGWTGDSQDLGTKALETAKKAIELNSFLPYAYWSLGRIYTRPYVKDNERGKVAFKKAIALNPNYADGYMFLALTYVYGGDAKPAVGMIEKAMQLNPNYPFWYLQGLGMAYFFLGDHEKAAALLRDSVDRNPNVPWTHRYLIAAYGALGRTEDAEWEISEVEMLGQPATVSAFMDVTPIVDPSYRAIYEDALRKAGLPE